MHNSGTKKIDPNAAIFAAEDRERQELLDRRLDVLGAPADARGRAEWFERRAEESRLEAGRRDVAHVAQLAAEAEADAIADRLNQEREARARVTQVLDDSQQVLDDLAIFERRQHAREVAQELAETGKALEEQLAERLRIIRFRVATKMPVTAGEMRLLEQFGATH